MQPNLLPTELILSHSLQSLGKIYLAENPQPGNFVELAGKNYLILERHHHYQYQINGYSLRKISLHVKESPQSQDKTLIAGKWIIGDATCRFNARSEIMRCAVNPEGACNDCHYYEAMDS